MIIYPLVDQTTMNSYDYLPIGTPMNEKDYHE
jgi:hypothetical protein